MYTGWHVQSCVLTGSSNAFVNALKGVKFSNKVAINHLAKGKVVASKNTGYWRTIQPASALNFNAATYLFTTTAPVLHGALTKTKNPKNTVAVVAANNPAATFAGTIASIVAAMPPAYMLPACSTWA